jgi:hypothetical protein
VKTFPKVLQVNLDLLFRPVDGGGDLPGRVRPLLQEGADLTPRGFRFLQLSDYRSGIHPLFHPPSEIALLPGGISERPVGIEKIVHERRRDDADRLMILRGDLREKDAQKDEDEVTDPQRDKRNDVELQSLDMELVRDVPFGKRPYVVEQEIGDDGDLYRDRGGNILVHPVMHQ